MSDGVEEVPDEATKERIDAALDEKYAAFRTAGSAMPTATRDHYAHRTFLRLVPEGRILTWDNRRIELRPGGQS